MKRTWTLEDEMDWADNVVLHRRNKEMRRGFDIAIEWSLLAIGIWSVVEAAKILIQLNS
jgi:hypothetical protein